ncbi:hypothetical protein FMM49_34775 [Streptomyces rimosus subsp. rimosus]|nr:hypothetical protein CP984_34215 [Streptomyces rimosus]QTL90193.1 hypothetical protein FMM49_34775 [Streptomyces rimosus subsp. rimosus]
MGSRRNSGPGGCEGRGRRAPYGRRGSRPYGCGGRRAPYGCGGQHAPYGCGGAGPGTAPPYSKALARLSPRSSCRPLPSPPPATSWAGWRYSGPPHHPADAPWSAHPARSCR